MSDSTLQQEIEALRPATEGTLQQVAKGVPLMGRDPDGKAKMINVDENGNVKVQQSGTIVEERIIVDDLEIRDTSLRSVIIDTSRYKSFELVAINTLGKEVRFTAGFNDTTNEFRYYNAEAETWVRLNTSDDNPLGYGTIPANTDTYHYLLSTVFPLMFSIRSVNLRFMLRCAEAPTRGYLRVILYGVVR